MIAFLPPFGSLAGELVRLALVLAAYGALFAVAEAWRRRFAPPVEWTRKLVHLGGGVVSATFPWLFAHTWPVLVMAAGALAVFAIGRRSGALRSVTAVERSSRGEAWFPIGVALLFLVARQDRVFWIIALSALVLSDTAAALIGRSYGRLGYRVGEDRRSLEGSGVFLLVTFLAVHATLLLATPIDRAASLLVAAQIALLVTSFEAISMRGNDNVVVPLGAYYLLVKMTPKPAVAIALQLGSQVGLLALTTFLAWRTRFLSFSGAVAAHLVLYAAWSLGGPGWTLAPLGALAGYLVLSARYGGAHGVPAGGHQVRAIYYTSIVGVLAIFADNSFATLVPVHASLRSGHPFQVLCVGAFAAPLAIVAYELVESTPVARRRALLLRAARAVGIAALCAIVPGLAVLGTHLTTEGIVVTLLVPVLAIAAHLALRDRLPLGEGLHARLKSAALATLLATLAALAVHFQWAGIHPWEAA